MKSEVRQLDFTGQKIFVGLDVHLKSWRVSIHLEEMLQKTFHLSPPGIEPLEAYLRRHYPGATYQCAYEAGFCGFWIQKGLAARGIETLVVNPADIPTTDKERQQKDDVRDSRKIARSLRNGELECIHVPNELALRDRSLVRYRWSLASDRKRAMNRIKSHLHFYGQHPPEGVMVEWKWDRAFMNWLREKAKEDATLDLLLQQFDALRALEKVQMKQIRALFKTDRYAPWMTLLRSAPGVGFLSAVQLLTEIEDIRRFKTFDQLCFFVGLVPGTDSSGENQRADERTTRGNKRLRTLLIECAWVAIRQDDELALAYSNLRKRMDGPHAIIKIARKLLNRIRRVWLSGNAYTPAKGSNQK